jgi:hypothetical protein
MKQILRDRYLTAGQLSALQRALSLIDETAEHAKEKGDDLLARELTDVVRKLQRIIEVREEPRRRYLEANRVPD